MSDEIDVSASMLMSLRARWPYVVGAIAGPVFGIGVLLLLGVVAGNAPSLWPIAVLGVALGGVGLAVAWGAVFGHGHGGVAVILGSLAVPAALVYLRLQPDRYDAIAHGVRFLIGAFTLCAWGHALVRHTGAFRVVAGVAAALWTAVFVLMTGVESAVPAAIGTVAFCGALGSIAVMGIALAFVFPALRSVAVADGDA